MLPLVVSLQTFGSLHARVVHAKDDTEVERVIVLLHGFGAPGDDLVSLAKALQPQKGTRFVFPEAPVDLGEGRAWWMIDWAERMRYERSGDLEGYANLVPAGLPQAADAVAALLDAIDAQWKPKRVVLGGFSQGAMLSAMVASRRAKKPDALILLSGALLAIPFWVPQSASLKGLPVFESHGTIDQVLPFMTGERLRDQLTKSGAHVSWHPFSGGHAIPADVLSALHAFLERKPHATGAHGQPH